MKDKNIDVPLMVISLGLILVTVAFLAVYPEEGKAFIGTMFSFVTKLLGNFMLWFGFLTFLYCCYMAFSKYGNIKLGDANDKPEFSFFQYLSMMICAGLGSASVIWSFVEWGYYYASPAQGIAASTPKAAEWATAYNLFHWGFTPWAMFVILAIPVSYAFHVRKIPSLKFSVICAKMMGDKPYTNIICRLIDFFFVFCVVGGLSVTLGLGIPIIASGISKIFGVEPSFSLNVFVTLGIATIFTISSYIGIEKGMKKLSEINVYIAAIFILAILFTGPTKFILDNITNALGLMLQNYIAISLWTDPISKSGFPEAWTIFFYAFGITYATLMALFITKVSKGRTMRQMICSVMFGGAAGCFILFGINGSFTLDMQLTKQLDMVAILFDKGNSAAIFAILEQSGLGLGIVITFVVAVVLFLATSLDSAAYSLSATSTRELSGNAETSPMLRLFWCVTLALIPLCMNFIGASLSTLQTLTIVTSIPFIFVILGMTKGLFTWLREDGLSK